MQRFCLCVFTGVLLGILGCDIGDTSPERMPLNPPGIAPLLDYNEAARPEKQPSTPPPAQAQPPTTQEQPPRDVPPPPPPPPGA